MSYHYKTKTVLKRAPVKTLGTLLGRKAIRKGFSVAQISDKTGASRTTVYSWLAGGTVSNAYRKPVEDLIAFINSN